MHCLKCLQPLEKHQEHYGLHHSCFQQWFNVQELYEFVSLARVSSSTSDLVPQNNSFFHGKFKKYSATLAEHSYILKMREKDAPELPEVEYLCNQIARILNVPIADFYYISFQDDKVFVTKNFIIPTSPIDLKHIYHFRSDDEHSCEGLIQAITLKTHRPYDIKMFIRLLLFDALIGNHDRHGRNLAFIVKANHISISPFYDNVSYLSLEQGNMLKADFNPFGKIVTKATEQPSMKDYVKELKRLDFENEINSFYTNLNIEKIKSLISHSFCSELMKDAITKLVEKRYLELANEISN